MQDNLWKNLRKVKFFAILKEKGFKQLELTGIMPGGLAKQHTSIFYRENNILEL